MVHKGKKKYIKDNMLLENSDLPKASKKAKIIVRNLPFKNLSEKSVEDFFKEYGDIEEVKLLKKDDGKFIGCGFVQFKKILSAAKAIRHANEKNMNGRKIVVDWALPKKTYLEKVQKLQENSQISNIKSEVLSDEENIEFEVDKKPGVWNNEESLSADESTANGKYENSEDEKMEVDYNENDNDDDNDDDDDDNDYYYDGDGDEDDYDKNQNKNKINNSDDHEFSSEKSNDVEEGKTVFIRNIPFSATNEDLRNCFENYGCIEYALICVDKLTEHSKGTGFVKFKDQESASKSIKDSTKIYLQDNPLTVSMALSKKNLESKTSSKKTVKDSRNLYLIREGTVIAGSKAGAGVSAGDMAKRLQLEQWKNQILKNLNMFVSRTRLVIHNLPPFYDDSNLRDLFTKYSNPKAVIKEAKVMYDKKKFDSTGKNVSKEVGFVSFTNHEDALQALRNINNNPEIFTTKKRPIVAFSIENKAVINTKLKRIEKSRAKLGIDDKSKNLSKLNKKQRRFIKRREKFIERRRELKKSKEKQPLEDLEDKKNKKNISGESANKSTTYNTNDIQVNDESERNSFTGVIAESGKKIKLRSKFRLKTQANIHNQTLKKERRKRREMERKKTTLRKTEKQKKGKPKLLDDVNLSRLLKKHRQSIEESSIIKKWYNN